MYSRALKSVPITPAVRAALDLDASVEHLTPAELMRAILQAPVDLLWNGGIGTYVKGAEETHAEVGDKANDAIRVNGEDVRARCVGEGGNLGLTQAGRVEYALHGGPRGEEGGRVNTDFIDNSAGVDTSDHEVNIKILLDRVVKDGDLTGKQRNVLLAEMTEEVGELVLRDNYEQNLALANAVAHAPSLLHVHEDVMRRLESAGTLDREIEGLPSRRDVRRRLERGRGLTTPELSVLMAWTKIVLADELLAGDLPDDPYLSLDLVSYFPSADARAVPGADRGAPAAPRDHRDPGRQRPGERRRHDLLAAPGRRDRRLGGRADARELRRPRDLRLAAAAPGARHLRQPDRRRRPDPDAHPDAHPGRARLALAGHPPPSAAAVPGAGRPVLRPRPADDGLLPELITGRELEAYQSRLTRYVERGAPEDLAARVAALDPAYMLLGVADIARSDDLDPIDVARVHFGLGERLGLPVLLQRIVALPREDKWQTMARAALRDDLHDTHAALTAQVLRTTDADQSLPARIAAWEDGDADTVARAAETLEQICAEEQADLARMSVGLRVVRGLLA